MRSPKKPEGRGGPLADELSEAIEEQLTELVTDLRGTADRQLGLVVRLRVSQRIELAAASLWRGNPQDGTIPHAVAHGDLAIIRRWWTSCAADHQPAAIHANR
jgi:hypothetical protein